MNCIKNKIKAIILSLIFSSYSGIVLSATQQIQANDGNDINNNTATNFSFDVNQITDNVDNLRGIGFQMFFDSNVLQLNNVTNIFTTDKTTNDTTSKDDSNNLDGKSDTDKYRGFAWANLGGSWNVTSPQKLLTANFTWRDDANKSQTTIEFVKTSQTEGRIFSTSPLKITGPCGTCADASKSTVIRIGSKGSSGSSDTFTVDNTATFNIQLKDINGNNTNNLAGKTLSLATAKGSASFSNPDSNGKIVAIYTPASHSGGSYTYTASLQFKLDQANIGPTQSIKVDGAPRTLTINKTTNGSVEIVGSQTAAVAKSSATCGDDCEGSYIQGTSVKLTANANSGYLFDSWGGDSCSGKTNPLTIIIANNTTCSANFIEKPDSTPNAFSFNPLTGVEKSTEITSNPITVSGINMLTSISISAGSYSVNNGIFTTDSGQVKNGDNVRVKHTSSNAYNSQSTTPLNIGGISADFISTTKETPTYTLTISDHTNGSVTATGIACPSDCSGSYLEGTSVKLTANANSGYLFDSWGGDSCSGKTNPLTIIIANNTTCSAKFDTDTDGDGIPNATDTDDDNDGMPDAWEIQHGLNPLVNDADKDLDKDGIINKVEFNNKTNPTKDSKPPVLSKGDKLILNSTGRKTGFKLSVFKVTSSDNDANITLKYIDINAKGTKTATIVNNYLILPSGRHTLTWVATDVKADEAGRTSAPLEQIVDVLPRADFAINQFSSKGQSPTIAVFLSGLAPQYPVTIPFSVDGNVETNDYSISPTFKITSGYKGTLTVALSDDNNIGENMSLVMGTPTHAIKGKYTTHKITILNDNQAPLIKKITVIQAGIKGKSITTKDGTVTVKVKAVDINGDQLTYIWSGTNFIGEPIASNTFTFNPVNNVIGAYPLKLTVDDGNIIMHRTIILKVIKSLNKSDEDGNGIPDEEERDDDYEPYELKAGNGKSIQTHAGTRIIVGAMGNNSGKLTLENMKDFYKTYKPNETFKEDVYIPEDIYDYTIEDLPKVGTSVDVIVGLTQSIPVNAVLRKYNLNKNNWSNFKIDSNNAIKSLVADDGICSNNDNAVWTSGLKQGANCLKLTIKDGGENDADGLENGVIEDPVAVSSNPPANVKPSSGGGGCALMPANINNSKKLDPTFYFILFMIVIALFRTLSKR